jgi:hypothetical protein
MHARRAYHARVALRTVLEFVMSGLKIAARANVKSLDPQAARLHRFEGSSANFSITSLLWYKKPPTR